jgi:hypothetical protein
LQPMDKPVTFQLDKFSGLIDIGFVFQGFYASDLGESVYGPGQNNQ